MTLPPPNTEDALRHHQIDVAALSGQFQQLALAHKGIHPLWTEPQQYHGPFNGGQYVFRNEVIDKNPDAVRAFTAGVAKAIEWEHTTPRPQVLAEFTKIIDKRHRTNEDTTSIKYWLSSGVPSKYGVISDQDFDLEELADHHGLGEDRCRRSRRSTPTSSTPTRSRRGDGDDHGHPDQQRHALLPATVRRAASSWPSTT